MRDEEAMLVGAFIGSGVLFWWAKRADAKKPGASPLSQIAHLAVPIAPAITAEPSRAAPLFDLGRPVPASVHALVSSGWSRARAHGMHRALDILVPVGTPVLAVDDGVVERAKSVDNSDAGLWVGVRHRSGLTSRSLHLSKVLVAKGQFVKRGEILGLSGETGDAAAPHLHLDLRVPASMLPAVEREIGRPLGGWGTSFAEDGYSIPGEPFVPVDEYRSDVRRDALVANVPLRKSSSPRNGSLHYRPLGATGEPYPEWLRALKDKSGVYVIRERGEIVYVGESHSRRLYDTLTRHFSTWRRAKGFWKGHYAEGHDPGLTYNRASVEVAVRVLRDDQAIDEERRLIARLKPRDNLLGQPELEEAPF